MVAGCLVMSIAQWPEVSHEVATEHGVSNPFTSETVSMTDEQIQWVEWYDSLNEHDRTTADMVMALCAAAGLGARRVCLMTQRAMLKVKATKGLTLTQALADECEYEMAALGFDTDLKPLTKH